MLASRQFPSHGLRFWLCSVERFYMNAFDETRKQIWILMRFYILMSFDDGMQIDTFALVLWIQSRRNRERFLG